MYDIKNLKQRIRNEQEHKYNSPWNIAADFRVDMSFTKEDIAGMLKEYEADQHCIVEIEEVAEAIFEYTSGYPYLVSKICKLIDEYEDAERMHMKWSRQGVTDAVQILLKEPSTLFDDMRKKIEDYPELKKMLYAILFQGETYPYNPDNFAIDIGTMFGFIRECEGQVVISNRIFETRLYNLFLSEEMTGNITYQFGERKEPVYSKRKIRYGTYIEKVHGTFSRHIWREYREVCGREWQTNVFVIFETDH